MLHSKLKSRSVIVLASGLLLLAACEGDDDTALQEAEEEGTASQFVGETITISGEIGEVVGPDAAIISGDYMSLGVDEGTLVYGIPEPMLTELQEGSFIQATGTVVEFLVADVESEFGVDYDDDVLVAYEEEFALQVESAEVVPELAAMGDDTALSEAEEDDTAESLVGETITVAGQSEEIIGPMAFRIFGDQPGEGTLVLGADTSELTEESLVEVTGTVVEFVLVDIEQEYGLDFDDELFVDYDDEFAIVADSVESVPEP